MPEATAAELTCVVAAALACLAADSGKFLNSELEVTDVKLGVGEAPAEAVELVDFVASVSASPRRLVFYLIQFHRDASNTSLSRVEVS